MNGIAVSSPGLTTGKGSPSGRGGEESLSYCKSSQVNAFVALKVFTAVPISSLPPRTDPNKESTSTHQLLDRYIRDTSEDNWAEVKVICRLFLEPNLPIGPAIQTRFMAKPATKAIVESRTEAVYDSPFDTLEFEGLDWVVFPIRYKDLREGSFLEFEILTPESPLSQRLVGTCKLDLFYRGELRQGKYKLPLLEAGADAGTFNDASSMIIDANDTLAHSLSSTILSDHQRSSPHLTSHIPLYASSNRYLDPPQSQLPPRIRILHRQMRKFEAGDIPRVDWMDPLTFAAIRKLEKQEIKCNLLQVQMLAFNFPIFFHAPTYAPRHVTDCPQVSHPRIIRIEDPGMFEENVVEAKYRKLVRSHRNGALDRDLKPDSVIRDELIKIMNYPPTKPLSNQEKDLLWKFRYHISKDKKSLTKFLKCVTWTDLIEVGQAIDMLPLWNDIDVEDALELLGPTFQNSGVRKYGVGQLAKASDEDLQVFLLQLVQALKFESAIEAMQQAESMEWLTRSPLVNFLVTRAINNPRLGNNFYWYLKVESYDAKYGKMYTHIFEYFLQSLASPTLPDGHHRLENLNRQNALVDSLSFIAQEIRASKETRPKKISRLQRYLSDVSVGLLSFPPLPLPLDPSISVTGMKPDRCTVFKSSLSPLCLVFTSLDGSEYSMIFKAGDDLRQDQLVVQIITLMDKLLRRESLDLKLSPYRVLACSPDCGMVQYVPSQPLAAILAENGNSLIPYLDSGAESCSRISITDTYIRSTAGYCVITYLLGIGDRHLDNLLLTKAGNLIHIDFGFILGRDPKPFPPPMKLTREMIEAMGGLGSSNYHKFKSFCFIAFSNLRKSANLILNLFALMQHANITDISLEPDKAVFKVQEHFCLELSDEYAIQHFHGQLNESLSALFPQVMEQFHKVAQMWRS